MSENVSYDYDIPEELIDGQPVAMSPRPAWRHIAIGGNLYHIFRKYLNGKSCKPIPDGMDLYLSDKDHFIPDMMVVCEREKIHDDAVYGAPSLVVEILSSSTAKRDRTYKKSAYEAAGVKEYWIVSPGECTIEVYILKGSIFVLDDVHTIYSEVDLMKMSKEEKAAIRDSFQCRLFPDLEISLEEVFDF